MFTPRQALLSAALCATLTVSSQASVPAPDENTSTNSSTFAAPLAPAQDPDIIKAHNESYALMSLTLDPLQQVCQILAENDAAETILALGQVSIHLASRILRRMGAYDNPNSRQAIRVDLRKAIKAREEELMILQKALEDQPEPENKAEPKAPPLDHWQDLLGANASLRNLCFASNMLRPQNIKRLQHGDLCAQLTRMTDKTQALAFGASAAQLFTYRMDEYAQASLLSAALDYTRPFSDYAAVGAACRKHFFTAKMSGWDQTIIIAAALESSCPISEYEARNAAYKEHLFMEGMEEWDQSEILTVVLLCVRSSREIATLGTTCKEHLFLEGMNVHDRALIITCFFLLSDEQKAQLVGECDAGPREESNSRTTFIRRRSKELRPGQ